MRVTSVWDDVQHHNTFSNPAVVEVAVSKHNGAAILQEMSYACLHLNNMTKSEQNFTTAIVFSFNCFSPRCRRQSQSRGMQKDNTEASHGHRRRRVE